MATVANTPLATVVEGWAFLDLVVVMLLDPFRWVGARRSFAET